MSQKNKNLIKFALLASLVTWGILAYIELGKYMYAGTLFVRTIDGQRCVSDFANHYNASLLARRCLSEKIAIYDINVQQQSLQNILCGANTKLPFYLQYPPYFFALVLPLSIFPSINLAWIAWAVLGLLAAIISLAILAGDLTFKQRNIAVLMVLSSYPAWLSIELGQTSLILFPALVGMLTLLPTRPLLAAISASVGMIKLQYMPVLLLAGLSVGKLRYLLGSVLAAVLLGGLSLTVLGVDNVISYPQALLNGETAATVGGVSANVMQNLRGELVLVLGEDSALVRHCAMGGFALSGIFLCWIWLSVYPKLANRDSDKALKLCASVTVLAALAFSIHTHTQDYLIAAIPCIWLWQHFQGEAKSNILTYLLLGFSGVSWLFFIFLPIFQLAKIQPFFFWNLFVLCGAVKEILRCKTKCGTPD